MISLGNKQRWNRPTLSAVIWLALSGLLATATAQSATGGVSGTIRLIINDKTVPLVGARVEVWNVSNDHVEHEAVTNKAGLYAIDLPEGTYKIHFVWVDGGCSIVRRAPFRLGASERLTFDFLTMHCPSVEGKAEVLLEVEKQEYSSPMELPLARQGDVYREQNIPAERDQWPQIVISFGRYDNQADETRYFPMHQALMNRPATAAPLLFSLPVTVTVDRYTLQASDVVLDKRAMVFTAKGNVFISDGKTSRMGNWATLSFSAGQPRLKMER